MLGSAGGPRRALPLLRRISASTFLHRQRRHADRRGPGAARRRASRRCGALVTMAVVPNTEPHKYGGAPRRMTTASSPAFAPRGSTQRSWHVVGVQVADAAAFASVPTTCRMSRSLTLYPALIAGTTGSRARVPLPGRVLRHRHAADYLAHVAAARDSRTAGADGAAPSSRLRASSARSCGTMSIGSRRDAERVRRHRRRSRAGATRRGTA